MGDASEAGPIASRPITGTTSTKHAVLDHYYDNVVSLQDYLASCLPPELASTLLDEAIDKPSYTSLLRNAYVAWSSLHGAPKLCARRSDEGRSLAELIRLAQRDLLSCPDTRDNVLCYGFVKNDGSVVNKYSNTSLTALQESKVWKVVLNRASGPCLLHLLKHTSLFVPVLDNALRQVCGPPLHSLKARSKRKDGEETPDEQYRRKRTRKHHSHDNPALSSRLLSRQSIFYGRCIGHTTLREAGLHSDNVLVSIDENFPQAALPEYMEDFAAARHLSKHIWPSKYHIDVMNSTRNERRSAIDRGIASIGQVNTPKSLKAVLPLLHDLLSRHRKCDYSRMLQKFAPSKLKHANLNQEQRSALFNAMSEDCSLPLTQLSTGQSDSLSSSQTMPSGLDFLPVGYSTEEASGKCKVPVRFTDFVIEHWRVIRYIQKCISDILPPDLLGSEKNLTIINAGIEQFVNARRGETFSISSMIRGFKMSDCKWGHTIRHRTRPSPSVGIMQNDLISDLIFWIFDHFVVDLLRANFYVTESSIFQRRTLYFLQKDWRTICTPLVNNMASTLFRKIGKEEATAMLSHPDRRLAFSKVRLLPKETGVRPIVNLSRRPARGASSSAFRPPSINQLLQNAFAILSFEKQRREELTGSATQAYSDIYRQIKAYKQTISTKSFPRLYIVKLDIRACFDSIDQDKLLMILESIVSEDDYNISKYTTSARQGRTVLKRFLKLARPTEDFVQFPDIAHQLADVLRRAVFVDQVRPSTESRHAVLELLREHIKDNIVKIGNSYYRQIVGIPQGSILSTLLCNFFYAHMEKEELAFTRTPDNLLMRLVDDFLFVSTDRLAAESFLRKMYAGHPAYGCFVSVDKTLVNFDFTINGGDSVRRIDSKTPFPWCGLLLNQTTLEAQYDYQRRGASHMTNVLTVRTHNKPGEAFLNTMLYALKMRTNIIFVDTDFAQLRTVYVNIYQALQFVAMKFHSYISIWKPSLESNMPFFLGVVHRVVHYAFLAIKSCFHPKLVKECGPSSDGIRRGYVQWLGYHAFLKVLSIKPTRYRPLLKQLKYLCASQQHASSSRALKPVLSHPSNRQFDKLRY